MTTNDFSENHILSDLLLNEHQHEPHAINNAITRYQLSSVFITLLYPSANKLTQKFQLILSQ